MGKSEGGSPHQFKCLNSSSLPFCFAPQVIDWGTVSVGTSNTCHLMVINTLNTPIHVVLDIKAVRELKGSKATSQVCVCACVCVRACVYVCVYTCSDVKHAYFCLASVYLISGATSVFSSVKLYRYLNCFMSQVIPPGARAKFPMTLIANDIRTFTEKVTVGWPLARSKMQPSTDCRRRCHSLEFS